MKILFLCDKFHYDTKMDRNRFHSIAAIENHPDCSLVYSGIGWPNFNDSETGQENINSIYGADGPDLVIAYKPLKVKQFSAIKAPKCLRYNEMWDKGWTDREIKESGANFIICHHKNDMPNYSHMHNICFVNVSHCSEATIYKDYNLPKKIDVLFSGAVSSHYPFRDKLRRVVNNHLKGVKCRVLSHPGDPGIPYQQIKGPILERYAQLINSSKIALTCSSRHKYRLSKYAEIPMSGALLAGDLPNDDQDFFSKFMLVLDPNASEAALALEIMHYVNNDAERENRIKIGIEASKEYTQEKYAERFMQAADSYLRCI